MVTFSCLESSGSKKFSQVKIQQFQHQHQNPKFKWWKPSEFPSSPRNLQVVFHKIITFSCLGSFRSKKFSQAKIQASQVWRHHNPSWKPSIQSWWKAKQSKAQPIRVNVRAHQPMKQARKKVYITRWLAKGWLIRDLSPPSTANHRAPNQSPVVFLYLSSTWCLIYGISPRRSRGIAEALYISYIGDQVDDY